MQYPVECVTASENYLTVQICSFCWLLLEEHAIFDPFGVIFDAKGAPKRIKICDLSLISDIYCQISGEKLFLYERLQLLRVNFREMGNFMPFLTPGVP